MGFSFEVRDSDLFGRIGIIRVNGKKVETPCLFPVVHPVVQSLGLREIRDIGFECLMTNAYILRRRRMGEALTAGLHRLLSFDGVLMTDSGGYQVLEYGDLNLSFAEIAEFQSKIGSDLAVTLDMPTGFDASRRRAMETERYSTRNALETLKEFGGSGTTWIGPVQGGLYTDLLGRSARTLAAGGFGFLALGSPVQVMENYMYPELVTMIAATRRSIPYAVPLHLFGAGHPHAMALAVALGCDTFDSASYILFAREGRYMTERGASNLKEMKYLPCSCPVCRGRSVSGLLDLEAGERTSLLAAHNLHVLRREVELCKEAIAEGRLWDLVEERAMAHPKLYEAFRRLASLAKTLGAGTSFPKSRGLFVRGEADRRRPELAIARSYLKGALRKGSRAALLLTGGEPSPLSRLKRGGSSEELRGFDTYRLHPQLGPYPLELDFVYPFTQTVTSYGELDPESTAKGIVALRRMGYSRVVRAVVDRSGRVSFPGARSRPKRGASSPSPRTASSLPRAPRRP